MDKLKAVIISDTHSREKKIEWFKNKENIDSVNMVIHCGDFSHGMKTLDEFVKWYGNLEIEYKILIAGNHDTEIANRGYQWFKDICDYYGIIYLQDTSVEIEGIKIHGSPWSNEYGNWSFMDNDFELDRQWQKIPDDTNILITHGPAFGKCDEVFQDIGQPNVGSHSLNLRINNLKDLTHHFVGHIHDSGGEINQDEKYTTYNACIMNYFFRPENKPYVFELN
jgi:Icc-related predicted phosphoesterase